MPIPFFKDIDKTASSLLVDDYKYFKHLKVKTKSENGVEFSSEAVMTGEGSEKAVLAKLGSVFQAKGAKIKKLEVSTHGRVVTEAVLPDLGTKGLAVTLKADGGQAKNGANKTYKDSVKVGFQFANDQMSAIADVDVLGGLAMSQVMYRRDNLMVGADQVFSMEKNQITDYNAGLAYKANDFVFAIRTKSAANVVNLSVAHKLSSAPVEVASWVSHNISKQTQNATVGCKYSPDSDTTLKAKVNTDGLLSLACIQKVSASMKLFAAAEVDAKNLEGDAHKFGLGIALS